MTRISNDIRPALVRAAFRLEYITIAWMIVEAAVAIGSGIRANSVSLLAFGLDSVIELVSAGVLIWRLRVELRHGKIVAESAERRAARVGSVLLFMLAAYVVASAGWSLWTGKGQEFSWSGLLVGTIAIPLMWALSTRKSRLADRLDSPALQADAVESIACGWFSFVVILGLLAQLVLGAWWLDAAASFAIVWLLIREARAVWEGHEDGGEN